MADEIPAKDELLAALDKVAVTEVIVQALAASASIGFRRVSAEARDLPQARLAIESIRALEPVLREHGVDEILVRDLEQARVNLQLAYAKAVGETSADAAAVESETRDPAPEEKRDAEDSEDSTSGEQPRSEK